MPSLMVEPASTIHIKEIKKEEKQYFRSLERDARTRSGLFQDLGWPTPSPSQAGSGSASQRAASSSCRSGIDKAARLSSPAGDMTLTLLRRSASGPSVYTKYLRSEYERNYHENFTPAMAAAAKREPLKPMAERVQVLW
eukprot:TRINITY_DN80956_c0_g1_i1.p1 TRINITY_DN80956_c0_g1~~TRINITY_DN80956_c0_g1_i1.p1  ORF type:complete len:139 (-),score=23.19 TRINITY_DN80956_c0_g1_i1:66-482(-)